MKTEKYTGTYFGVNFYMHVFEPTKDAVDHLLHNFKHKYKVNDYVIFRIPHRKTEKGKITNIAYSTEKNGGGTIKVYKINNKWVCEDYIKGKESEMKKKKEKKNKNNIIKCKNCSSYSNESNLLSRKPHEYECMFCLYYHLML